MKLLDILAKYDTHLLDQIAADKIDEAITLRLPQSVILQEIMSALSSQSYLSNKILYGKPPTFAILNLILQSPDSMLWIEGFQAKVFDYVNELSRRAAQSRTSNERNASLYIKILKRAWENDNQIDKSEAHILELVKQELGIWDKEHYMLMHDESIIDLWNLDQEYYVARNQLLASGIMLADENKYIIAEEVAAQIRKALGIEIKDESFTRLLNSLSKDDLVFALGSLHLNISGSKNIMTERLLNSLIPASEVLSTLSVESLRDLCRQQNIQVSGTKNIVITNLLQYFDQDKDIVIQPVEINEPKLPSEPELREMDVEIYKKVLLNLSGQQLYDILFQSSLMTSGSKEEKVKRILESRWSERTILNHLRKEDLGQMCRRFLLAVSGSKQELVDRLLDYTPPTSRDNNVSPQISPTVSIEGDKEQIIVPENEIKIGAESPLPSNWDQVTTAFPDLEYDEKIVIAILMEAKSLTERELERVVIKHKLGWFLHKAHMAELIAKLKRTNKAFIQIKSVQNNNIYQWVASDKVDVIIERKNARDIIDALRHGVVPRNNLDLLMVGQQTARKHLSEILLEVNTHKSHFKFIRGQYGSGKTFLCSWLKEFAIDNEFAVSFMNISHDQPLSDLPVFFSGMINGLRTPEKTDSSALVDILESWLLNIHNKTAKIEGIDKASFSKQKELSQIVQKAIEVELANLNDIEPGFSQAVRAFYEGKVENNIELTSNAVAWITGSKSLSSQALRDIGVKGYLEANNVFPRMRAILEIISGARYKGLLLLVDELELIRKFPHARQREQALETLRLLIDEAGRNALPGCLIIFTGTDEFFEDERYGLRSYEALAERVMTPLVHENFVSMRQPIISLESLDRERLSSVIFKIRDLYSVAYNWEARQFADDTAISGLIHDWTIFGDENIERKPRPILREFIQMLDLCEENRGIDLSQFVKRPKFDTVVDSPFLSN